MEFYLKIIPRSFLGLIFILLCSSCGGKTNAPAALSVTAVENFLADIAQNVAGNRITVNSLIPSGIDPHEFQPSPKDLAAVAQSKMLIVNGAGMEGWLSQALNNVGGTRLLITASQGLSSRPPGNGATASCTPATTPTVIPANIDPHFWMDPVLVKTYAANIRDGFIQIDPAGQDIYRQNAAAYSTALDALDLWIRSQINLIPPSQRLLVTNHESLGYFADRYGFQIVGAIIPNVSPDAEPSAAQIADLIQRIRSTGAKAIFLETGTNPQLANQISRETGCRIVTDLYTHFLTPPGGVASTYLDMMRHDVTVIVEALQ
jgi:ABC-type Zn uptake system ZnuABC Zn-binding protein ZnuA